MLAILVTIVWLAGVAPPGRVSLQVAGSRRRLAAGFRAGAAAIAIPMIPTLLTLALAIGITGTWSLGSVESYVYAVSAAATLAILLGCAVAAGRWLDAGEGPATPIDPAVTLRLDRRLSIVAALVGAVIVGGLLIPATAGGLWLGSLAEDVLTRASGWPGVTDPGLLWGARWWDVTERFAPSRGILWAGLALLPGLIVLVLTLLTRPWPRYVIVVCVLAARRQLPLRFARFLADAHRRGILRRSAGSYQFRHVRLQEQLVTRRATGRPDAPPAFRRIRLPGLGLPSRVGAAGVLVLLASAVLVAVLPRNSADATLHGDYGDSLDRLVLRQVAAGFAYEPTFSARGNLIAVHSERDDTIRVYSSHGAPEASLRFPEHEVVVRRVEFSPDERLLFAVGEWRHGTRSTTAIGAVWDVRSPGRWIRSFDLGTYAHQDPELHDGFRFTEDGRILVVTNSGAPEQGRDPEILLWDTVTHTDVFKRQTGQVIDGSDSMLVYLPSGRTELRRTADGAVLRTFGKNLDAEEIPGRIPQFTGPDDRFVVCYDEREGLVLWDARSGDRLLSFGRAAHGDLIIFDEHAEVAVVQDVDQRYRVWNLRDRKVIGQTDASATDLTSADIDMRHGIIATMDVAGSIRTWTLDGKPIRDFAIPVGEDASFGVAVSPDGRDLVVTDGDLGAMHFLPLSPGLRRFTAKGSLDESGVGATTFWTPDENGYQIFRLTDKAPISSFHGKIIESPVVFGADRRLVEQRDGERVVRDMSTGRIVARLRRVNPTTAVDLGETFAAEGDAGSLEVRSKADGSCIARLVGHAGPIAFISASPKKDLLASSSADGTVRLWRLPAKADPDSCAD